MIFLALSSCESDPAPTIKKPTPFNSPSQGGGSVRAPQFSHETRKVKRPASIGKPLKYGMLQMSCSIELSEIFEPETNPPPLIPPPIASYLGWRGLGSTSVISNTGIASLEGVWLKSNRTIQRPRTVGLNHF